MYRRLQFSESALRNVKEISETSIVRDVFKNKFLFAFDTWFPGLASAKDTEVQKFALNKCFQSWIYFYRFSVLQVFESYIL